MDAMQAQSPTRSSIDEAALSVEGMHCASCISTVERAVRSVGGVESCDVNFARGRAVVRFDSNRTDASAIAKAISDSGYQASPESDHVSPIEHEEHRLMHQAEHAKAWLRRAIVGIALWLPVELTHWILILTGHPH